MRFSPTHDGDVWMVCLMGTFPCPGPSSDWISGRKNELEFLEGVIIGGDLYVDGPAGKLSSVV
jgi:hypothetical protein